MKLQVKELDEVALAQDIINLRIAGFHVSDIASQLDVPIKRVKAVLDAELDQATKDLQMHRDHLLTIEIQRCEALQRAVWPAAMSGDLKAVNTSLQVMKRRADLLGLDAPTKANIQIQARVDHYAPDLSRLSTEELQAFMDLYNKALPAPGEPLLLDVPAKEMPEPSKPE